MDKHPFPIIPLNVFEQLVWRSLTSRALVSSVNESITLHKVYHSNFPELPRFTGSMTSDDIRVITMTFILS